MATMSKPKKKARKKTPNAKCLEELRRLGFQAAIVEQTIPHTFVKRDLFNVIDIVAINGTNTIGIQATSGGGSKGESNRNARRVKILAEPRALLWIESGNLLELWNYDADGALQREEIVAEDFAKGATP